MAEIPPGPSEPLDVQRIHDLARLMKRYDLTSLDLTDGEVQIRLRRRGPELASHSLVPQAMTGVVPAPHPIAAVTATPPAESAPQPAASAEKTVVIESPMVGTYYTSRSPDAPPLVTVGSVVQQGTIVCIIEAMKVFTDIPAGVSGTIPAGVSGTIVEVLAKNGQPVEYGQPLFRVALS
jgi:acetyl-CoA carboxylase biotin carboxyl carrier protein